MADQRFTKQHRVRRRSDFQRIYRRRCSAADAWLLVFGCENGLPFARLGVVVSRKYGRAVARNRWKRLIREAFRLQREQLPPGVDLLVSPHTTEYPELKPLLASLQRLARRVAAKLTPVQRTP